ncbi:predicted protein, partial [Nematostella vectensis]
MASRSSSKEAREKDSDSLSPLITGGSSSTLQGSQASNGKSSSLGVTLCILLTELCERLTFYGITANLVPFCEDSLGFKRPMPSTVNLLFQGTCYFIPVFGGWLADTFMGRYNVIYGSCLVYFFGTVLFAAGACTTGDILNIFGKQTKYLSSSLRKASSIVALVVIAFGTGGIKANVSPFGADQVQGKGPRAVQKFFNWFYWFINIGSFLSFTLIVWVQQKYTFFYGYAVTAISMMIGTVVFMTGRNWYVVRPPGGSVLTDTYRVVKLAIKRHWSSDKNLQSEGIHWLDRAKESYGGAFSYHRVENVKSLIRLLPVFAMFIIYWTLYSQMQTSYLIQAEYMMLDYGIQLPAASLSIFDIVCVLLLIPLMDKVVYPLLRYCGVRFTPLRRVGVGMLFAAASVAVAGLVEIERKRMFRDGQWHTSTMFNKTHNVSDMSIFYQVPQFMLIGTSEVFTSITGLEFAYSQAPRCLQGLVMGIFLVTSGLGNYLASALTNIVTSVDKSWYPTDPNTGHLENYFFLLAILMVANFIIYILVAMRYK